MSRPRARIRWNGDAVFGRARAGAARGLQLGAEHLLAGSLKEVPIAEVTLERSGTAAVGTSNTSSPASPTTPRTPRACTRTSPPGTAQDGRRSSSKGRCRGRTAR